ncbi:MAG: LysE family transporter [Gemmatimonadota bacterium]|nr:LysE family transporter [Gemmatimonadota bacterium]
MDSIAGIFIGSFVIGLSGAMMPGPLFVVVLSQSPRRGPWTGPVAILGHGVLEAALVGAVILGLAGFLSSPAVTQAVALAGGLVLLYMGVDMLRSAPGLSLEEKPRGAGDSKTAGMHPFQAGIFCSLANPFWTIWWATIGLGYLLIARQAGPAGLAAFLTGHILSDLAWYTVVSVMASSGRHWLTDPVYRGVIRACAVALLGFAVYFGYYGINGTAA